MADFQAGDRMVKMSGNWAGRYGTVNSVMDNGTLNVTFDGERIPKYCNPELCGKVAANAFKVGDRVKSAKYPELGEMRVERVFQDIHGTAYRTSRDGFLTDDIHYDRTLIPANAAANATFKVGDRVRLAGTVSPGLGKTGVVVKVDREWGDVTVKTDDGKTYQYEASAVQKVANSRACNAKFKVGDRVAYYGNDPAIYRKRGRVSDVSQIRGETFVTVDLDNGEEWGAPEKDWSFMNSRACNAKFKVGDKISYSVFGQTKTGTVVEVAEKFHSEYGNEHEGEQTYMVDFGKKPYSKTWESRMTLANSSAANAKFKVGDRVHHGNVMYISKSNPDRLVGTITKWDDERGAWEVKFKDDPRPVYWTSKEMVKYVPRNSTACNSVEVEVSLSYAGRVQHAMRDAARSVSGVRMTSSNTLVCPDDDAADDVIEIIKSAGVPADEVWTNASARLNWAVAVLG